jgi:hypothetical protein
MKQTVQMQEIQNSMKPGVIVRDGFLGTDARNLVDILTDDEAGVARLGLTHRGIADRMVALRDAGAAGLGEFIDVPPRFEVRVDSVRGKLRCPFGDPGIFPKTNTTVRNTRLGREITYTDLHIHMIGSHGFYEGKGSQFRLEPGDLAEVLEVPPPARQ